MANTLLEIRNEVFTLIGEPSDSTDDFGATRIDADINMYQDLVIKGSIKSEVDGTIFRTPDLRFMRTKSFITWHSTKNLTTAVETTDTTIYFDASDYETSGYVMIEGDVITYTGKTDTSITGVTGISTTHAVGKEVRQVYLIPTTAWKVFGIEFLVDGLVGGNFVDVKDFRSQKDILKYYTVLGSEESITENYVDIYGYSNNDRFAIHYYKKATDMTTDTATTDLPDNYGKFVLAPLVAGSLLYYTDEQALGLGILKKAYSNLETMYSQYSDIVKQYRPSIHSTSINSGQPYFTSYRY